MNTNVKMQLRTMWRRRTRHLRALTAIFPMLVLAVAACGVPTGDGTFERIATEDISPALAAEATTTTTPTTTLVEFPTTAPTTTIGPESFDTVEIYFLSRGLLRPVELTIPAPVANTDVIQLLEVGPPESATGLDTAVPAGLVIDLSISGGVVTIDLNEAEFDDIERRDQQSAIAQMVYTYVLNLQGVGQALFTLEGDRLAVPRGDNRLTFEPVAVDDYSNLLADQPFAAPPPTTTTTTINTTTTISEPRAEAAVDDIVGSTSTVAEG